MDYRITVDGQPYGIIRAYSKAEAVLDFYSTCGEDLTGCAIQCEAWRETSGALGTGWDAD